MSLIVANAEAKTPTMYDVVGVYDVTSKTKLSEGFSGIHQWRSSLLCSISAIDSDNGTISCTQPNYGYLNTGALQIISKGKKMIWTLDGPAISQIETIITSEIASWAANNGYYLDTSSLYYDIKAMYASPIGLVKRKKTIVPNTGTFILKGHPHGTGLADKSMSPPGFIYNTKLTFNRKTN